MSDELSAAPPWEAVGREPARPMRRAGMIVDLNRCVGCHSCAVACKTEHSVPLGVFRNRTHYLQRPDSPKLAFVPMLCMHCQDAPCMDACPTGALERLADGRVTVARERCNGTKACIPACPYGAIAIHPGTGKAEKCDFCEARTAVGLEPACVEACPVDALRFGDLDDAASDVAREAAARGAVPYKPHAGTRPSVLYVGHEAWMEDRARSVQLAPGEDGIVHAQ